MNSIELAEVSERLGQVSILDVRNVGEYDGTRGSSCDPRQGHIPGAVNIPVEELMTLTEEQIQGRLGAEPGAEVVVYCHSGSRSLLGVQILAEAGYNARNYVGSWHEWSRTELPLEA